VGTDAAAARALARELEAADAAHEAARQQALRDTDARGRVAALAVAELREEVDLVAAAWGAVENNRLAVQTAAELEVPQHFYNTVV
jgi:hypothetical protein